MRFDLSAQKTMTVNSVKLHPTLVTLHRLQLLQVLNNTYNVTDVPPWITYFG